MSESWSFIFEEMISGVISTVFSLLKVLIPLMVIIEILMVYKVIEWLANKLEGLAKFMGMSKNAIFPLLVGIIMGVSYGAGTIVEINSKTPLSKKDLLLVGVFIFMCHGIIETGLLFGIAGANVWVVTIGRLLIAFAFTIFIGRLPFMRKMIS